MRRLLARNAHGGMSSAVSSSVMTSNPRPVSAVIIIPAYNSSATIGETLIAVQENPEIDWLETVTVVVLNNFSLDSTVDVAKSALSSALKDLVECREYGGVGDHQL